MDIITYALLNKKKADLIDGKVPSSQLPSYVDDVIEVETYEDLPVPGEKGKIYVVVSTNKTYRWSGTTYIEITSGGGTVDQQFNPISMNAQSGIAVNQAISTKADKVTNATVDNFASLDANGNLTDSGKKASDFSTATNLSNGSSYNSLQQSGNIAGCKGWECATATDYNRTNKTMTVSDASNLAINDVMSAQFKNNFDLFGKITAISGNTLTFDIFPTLLQADVAVTKFYVWCPAKPNAGNYILGDNAFATGTGSKALQIGSFAEGKNNISAGKYSHTEGQGNTAVYSAHAENWSNKALGEASHAQGYQTTASGVHAHTEGYKTTASAHTAHAQGYQTTASGAHSFTGGLMTVAGQTAQTSLGQYNNNKTDTLFEVGNGTADNTRSNAFEVYKNGQVISGSETVANDNKALTTKKYVDDNMDQKQSLLVSGTNIKTINGDDVLGSGNLEIKTYQSFPNGQILSGTLQEVVAAIKEFPGKTQGMGYLGGISGSCTPFGYGNAECTVTFMTSNIAVLTVSSSNVSPYHWEYNTASNDYKWRKYSDVIANPSETTTNNLLKLSIDGVAYNIPGSQDKLTSQLVAGHTVGGVTAGTTFAAGTTLETILRAILETQTPVVTGTIYFGITDNIPTMTSILNPGENEKVTTTSIIEGVNTYTGTYNNGTSETAQYFSVAYPTNYGNLNKILNGIGANEINLFTSKVDGDYTIYYIGNMWTDTDSSRQFVFTYN